MDQSVEHKYVISKALSHLLFTSGPVKNPLLFTVLKLLMSRPKTGTNFSLLPLFIEFVKFG